MDRQRTRWSIGVQGAVAELPVRVDEPASVTRTGNTIVERRHLGALRITISAQAVAVVRRRVDGGGIADVLLAASRPASGSAPVGLTPIGRDRHALHAAHRDRHLFDVGLGFDGIRFLIRTHDREVQSALRALGPVGLVDLLTGAGPLLIERSPQRVVTSAVGRIEVYTPIPPPDGASPDGPHTHLLHDRLEARRSRCP